MSGLVDIARDEARRFVEPLGRRWLHVRAVAAAADYVARHLGLDGGALVAAAWLHDVGYSPELTDTGWHPIDGARYLREEGWDELIVSLVAHHSYAQYEAEVRDLVDELEEFPRPPADYEDAICFCDMTTGPGGDPVTAVERLEEIQNRYGPGHPVTRFVDFARPEILAAVGRVEARLRGAEQSASAL